MNIQVPQIIFQIVNFSLVLGTLSYFLYKPILKILDQRADKIVQNQKKAEELEEAAKRLNEEKATLEMQIQQKTARTLEETHKKAKLQTEKILEEAREQAVEEIEKAKQKWEEDKKKQIKKMKEEFDQAVIAVVEKVLGDAFDKKTHTKIIDKELEALLK